MNNNLISSDEIMINNRLQNLGTRFLIALVPLMQKNTLEYIVNGLTGYDLYIHRICNSYMSQFRKS